MRRGIGGGRGRAASVVGALFVPLAAGCTQVPASATQQLVRADEKFRAGQFDEAHREVDGFLKSYPRHDGSAEAYYLRALCHERLGRKRDAAADLKHCLGQSPGSVLAGKAHAMAGAIAFESGDAGAARHFDEALKLLGDREPADSVHWLYGVLLQRQGEWKKSREHFGVVAQKFPNSRSAESARRMQAWKDDYYSIQCGAFRDAGGAQQVASKLSAAGLEARIERRSRSGEVLNTVCVGRYATYAAAVDALSRVKRHESGAVIVPEP